MENNGESEDDTKPSHSRQSGGAGFAHIFGYGVVIGIITAIVIIFFSGTVNIQVIEWRKSGGEDDISPSLPQEVIARVESVLDQKKFVFFSHRNFFLLSRSDIQQSLEDFPAYTITSVDRRFPDTLVVYIEQKIRFSYIIQEYMITRAVEPVISAVPEDGADSTDTEDDGVSEPSIVQQIKVQKYFRISEQGTILEEVSRESVGEDHPSIKILTSRPLVVGENTIPANMWGFIIDVYGGFERATTIPIESFEIGDDLLRSEVRVVTKEGWTVFFDSAQLFSHQLSRLAIILKDAIKEKRPSLHSIDLRIPDKVFYQ
ncbi:MAG: hypothetical protein A3H59_02650 [Candidatus Jacksonbacteria bacterium RIFCSPLOWO2_02_FULL_43_9]|nr:MAG: hypothetical protein UV70_C0011G0021 [Parcubacteria group bacterium GW2011_GWA2_43_13]OGY69329.1 MAG: hypothetical protein A3B94_03080 [Candidatus Jacksonbacteria bacterium RIFCSPHIGHO2_02_FULL_43_10]OGY71214.1 MAG: hypothetical protein A2986_00100 [Candidatus Jacksonbacteria bacterium RIFCSPLOWO2_01_FULL_44_13]OGY71914.1 MAG: hypothetical protein A3H59_02650 [Candidatus Jacksonbacteria bacterium RIFCSPLOWO2_02_FULL_43_9]HAZ16807.1 hypothetical protein [Candidatus Jacksonbacteria bacter